MSKTSTEIKFYITVILLGLAVVFATAGVADSRVFYGPAALLGTGEVTSAMILDDDLVNADINATAAIGYAKLDLTGFITNADVTSTAAIEISKLEAATTSWFIVGAGSNLVFEAPGTARTSMALGDMAVQTSTDVSITGGTITGITDLAVADGGTGQSWDAIGQGGIVYFSSTGTLSVLPATTIDYVLTTKALGADPIWAAVTAATANASGTIVSENLHNSNDTETTTASATFVKLKEVLLNEDLANVRVKYALKTSETGHTATANIYKNGSAVGTEQTHDGETFSVETDDVGDFVATDLLQIYVKVINGRTATIKDMRFYYDRASEIVGFGDDTLDSPLTASRAATAISVTNQDP